MPQKPMLLWQYALDPLAREANIKRARFFNRQDPHSRHLMALLGQEDHDCPVSVYYIGCFNLQDSDLSTTRPFDSNQGGLNLRTFTSYISIPKDNGYVLNAIRKEKGQLFFISLQQSSLMYGSKYVTEFDSGAKGFIEDYEGYCGYITAMVTRERCAECYEVADALCPSECGNGVQMCYSPLDPSYSGLADFINGMTPGTEVLVPDGVYSGGVVTVEGITLSPLNNPFDIIFNTELVLPDSTVNNIF